MCDHKNRLTARNLLFECGGCEHCAGRIKGGAKGEDELNKDRFTCDLRQGKA